MNSICSYTFVSQLEDFKSQSTNIIGFLMSNFIVNENYLINLFVNNIDATFKIIENNSHFLIKKQINHNVIEFTDGLYFMEDAVFFYKNNKKANKVFQEITCIRNSQKTYINIANKKPKIWLKHLSKNIKNLEEFCTTFGKFLLKENNTLNKKK